MSNQQPVIIIKKKKGGGHGHHGGAWKVAYADFVTAMMAFFLLLWLLNVTTSVQRQGLADYFAPASASLSNSGAGGVMGGMTLGQSGSQMAAGLTPGEGALSNDPWASEEEHETDEDKNTRVEYNKSGDADQSLETGDAVDGADAYQRRRSASQGYVESDTAFDSGTDVEGTVNYKQFTGNTTEQQPRNEAAFERALRAEEKNFEDIRDEFQKALEASPDLQELADNLLVDA